MWDNLNFGIIENSNVKMIIYSNEIGGLGKLYIDNEEISMKELSQIQIEDN